MSTWCPQDHRITKDKRKLWIFMLNSLRPKIQASGTSLGAAVERDNAWINARSRKWVCDFVSWFGIQNVFHKLCFGTVNSFTEIGLVQICYHLMEVSLTNRGPPKSSTLVGFSLTKTVDFGVPLLQETSVSPVRWSNISTHRQIDRRTQRQRWSSAWGVFGAQPGLPWPSVVDVGQVIEDLGTWENWWSHGKRYDIIW